MPRLQLREGLIDDINNEVLPEPQVIQLATPADLLKIATICSWKRAAGNKPFGKTATVITRESGKIAEFRVVAIIMRAQVGPYGTSNDVDEKNWKAKTLRDAKYKLFLCVPGGCGHDRTLRRLFANQCDNLSILDSEMPEQEGKERHGLLRYAPGEGLKDERAREIVVTFAHHEALPKEENASRALNQSFTTDLSDDEHPTTNTTVNTSHFAKVPDDSVYTRVRDLPFRWDPRNLIRSYVDDKMQASLRIIDDPPVFDEKNQQVPAWNLENVLTPGTLVYTDVNIYYYAMPNATTSAMTMEATMVKILGEAYEIPDDTTLRSATPGPSSPRKRQHSQPNIFTPSPKKRPPPKREPIDLAEKDKTSDMFYADISEE